MNDGASSAGAGAANRPPRDAVVVGAGAFALFAVPVVALIVRAPWSSLGSLWHSDVREAAQLSLVTSLLATVLALVLGVPLAWVQARTRYRGQAVVRAVTLLPMVLPPVVGGIALLLAAGRRGLLGGALDRAGITLPFHLTGAVLAETFVAMPFLVLTVEAGLRAAGTDLEDAARTLGAGSRLAFWRVTLPLIRPSLVAGALLCWARAVGEFGATITFAGNLPGRTQTLPLFVYVKLESGERDAAVMLSVALLAVSVIVIAGLRDRWWR